MKRSYNYEMEVFVSGKLGFGFLLETKQVSDHSYIVKMLRFDPKNKIADRKTILRSTVGGLSFNECCDKIAKFKALYDY